LLVKNGSRYWRLSTGHCPKTYVNGLSISLNDILCTLIPVLRNWWSDGEILERFPEYEIILWLKEQHLWKPLQ
jgi:hypothetical protein